MHAKKAEENPWYLLATLYGVPEQENQALRDRNRIAWNRYFAANLDEETRVRLIYEKRHPAEELTPFSPEEQHEVPAAFVERCMASGKKLALPDSSADINFSNVEFDQEASFKRYLFSRSSSFQDSTFSSGAIVDGATFAAKRYTSGPTFCFGASFERAAASVEASFATTTFSGEASFGNAVFHGRANFDTATFARQISFVNTEMKGETSFEGTMFKTEPPRFFGAKLHEGTVWRGIRWPKPKDKDTAGSFLDAYERLKLEMDRLKKHEDELDFFALELQSRRVLQESLLKGSGLPIALYGLLSDYGRSYARPLYALFAVAAVGTLVLLISGALSSTLAPWQSLGLSFANTFNIFGFRKDFFDATTIETSARRAESVFRRSNHLRRHSPLPFRPRHSQ